MLFCCLESVCVFPHFHIRFQGCRNGWMLTIALLIFQGSCLLLTQAGFNKSPGDLERAAKWVIACKSVLEHLLRECLWVTEAKVNSWGASLLIPEMEAGLESLCWDVASAGPGDDGARLCSSASCIWLCRADGPSLHADRCRALSPSSSSPVVC